MSIGSHPLAPRASVSDGPSYGPTAVIAVVSGLAAVVTAVVGIITLSI